MSLRSIFLALIFVSASFAFLCDPNNIHEGILKESQKDYVLFAGSGYTFAGSINSTFLTGDIASFPTASPLASNPMVTLYGTEVSNETTTNIAANDLIDMYNIGLLKAGRNSISGDIGSLTFTPGLYYAETTIGITGDLTLDAQGNSSAVFIFISGSALFNSPGSKIILVNGTTACNVFWFIGSSATLNTNSFIVGTMNAYASISVGSNSTIVGRLLARQAITIDASTVSLPTDCMPPVDVNSTCNSTSTSPISTSSSIPPSSRLPSPVVISTLSPSSPQTLPATSTPIRTPIRTPTSRVPSPDSSARDLFTDGILMAFLVLGCISRSV